MSSPNPPFAAIYRQSQHFIKLEITRVDATRLCLAFILYDFNRHHFPSAQNIFAGLKQRGVTQQPTELCDLLQFNLFYDPFIFRIIHALSVPTRPTHDGNHPVLPEFIRYEF